jgi:hypothetical protein
VTTPDKIIQKNNPRYTSSPEFVDGTTIEAGRLIAEDECGIVSGVNDVIVGKNICF